MKYNSRILSLLCILVFLASCSASQSSPQGARKIAISLISNKNDHKFFQHLLSPSVNKSKRERLKKYLNREKLLSTLKACNNSPKYSKDEARAVITCKGFFTSDRVGYLSTTLVKGNQWVIGMVYEKIQGKWYIKL